MKSLIGLAALLGGLAAGCGSGLAAAGDCAALAGRAYTFEIAGASADFSTGKMTFQHLATIGRIVMGAGTVGQVDAFRRSGDHTQTLVKTIVCDDRHGPFAQLIVPGLSFMRFLPEPSGRLALMEQISWTGAAGEARPSPAPAGGAYSSCAAADGSFVGTTQGASAKFGATARLMQATLAAGVGSVRGYRAGAGGGDVTTATTVRARCTAFGTGGAGRLTYRDGNGVIVGSAIVYAFGKNGGFAIVDETTPDDPAAGWLAAMP